MTNEANNTGDLNQNVPPVTTPVNGNGVAETQGAEPVKPVPEPTPETPAEETPAA